MQKIEKEKGKKEQETSRKIEERKKRQWFTPRSTIPSTSLPHPYPYHKIQLSVVVWHKQTGNDNYEWWDDRWSECWTSALFASFNSKTKIDDRTFESKKNHSKK